MKPDREIDITGETCPMTFVRTKLAIEEMKMGEILAVLIRGDEPLVNVPRAVCDHGHAIIEDTELANGLHRLLIRIRR